MLAFLGLLFMATANWASLVFETAASTRPAASLP
jgi:hypothetical protein